MITYIKINGFKSFHEFEINFTPFTVIAGVNASGKSNLFDALKLLSDLAEVDNLKTAFKAQRGEFIELFTQYGENEYAKEIEFIVEMLVNKTVNDAWGSEAVLKYTRLRYELKIKRFTNDFGMEDLAVTYEHLENLKHQKDQWIKLLPTRIRENWRPKVTTGRRQTPYIMTEVINDIPTVTIPQDGSQRGNKRKIPLNNVKRTVLSSFVLSSFESIDFRHILAAKEEIKSWKFLELNPEDLCQATHKGSGEDTLGKHGEYLAGVLYRIKREDKYTLCEISRKLQTFLPQFTEVDVIDDKENQQYLIKLKDKNKRSYTSRVLSAGTLRILALCILEYDEKHTGLLCFEEPENGIHPFRIEAMAQLLKDLSVDFTEENSLLRQVIINTHSPVLVDHIYHWDSDSYVSIWYAEMINRATNIEDKRVQLDITRILPVMEKGDNMQVNFPSLEEERKLALYQIKKYLEAAPS